MKKKEMKKRKRKKMKKRKRKRKKRNMKKRNTSEIIIFPFYLKRLLFCQMRNKCSQPKSFWS